jgi:hypothetical protein
MRNVLDKCCRENQNTHFAFSNFKKKILLIWDNVKILFLWDNVKKILFLWDNVKNIVFMG